MARSIATIQNQIIANIQSNSNLSGLNSASNTAMWRLLTWIVAVAINLLEQLWDIFKGELESIAASSITGNTSWLRQQVLNFQYGYSIGIDPVTFVPKYAVTDTTAQLVSRCSVVQTSNNVVSIKVATGNPPAPLGNDQQTALQAYLDAINFAGIQFNLVNLPPDILFVQGTVYYNGQYVNSIKTTVVAALNNYITNLSSVQNFNGIVRVSDIENTIRTVAGVKDVVLENVWVRPAQVVINSATVSTTFTDTNEVRLINEYTEDTINYSYQPISGYIINEAAPYDFTSELTFTIA